MNIYFFFINVCFFKFYFMLYIKVKYIKLKFQLKVFWCFISCVIVIFGGSIFVCKKLENLENNCN